MTPQNDKILHAENEKCLESYGTPPQCRFREQVNLLLDKNVDNVLKLFSRYSADTNVWVDVLMIAKRRKAISNQINIEAVVEKCLIRNYQNPWKFDLQCSLCECRLDQRIRKEWISEYSLSIPQHPGVHFHSALGDVPAELHLNLLLC
jgi:hypothetical protein